MALTNIEYGSMASSSVMNNNFSYLDDKISDTAESVAASISSITSNIATINSRISEVSGDLQDSAEDLETSIINTANTIKAGVNGISMIPNWSGCSEISSLNNYTAPSNGYIILVSTTGGTGNLIINNVTTVYKTGINNYDHSSQWVPVPVAKNDVITCTCPMLHIYFLPAKNASYGS